MQQEFNPSSFAESHALPHDPGMHQVHPNGHQQHAHGPHQPQNYQPPAPQSIYPEPTSGSSWRPDTHQPSAHTSPQVQPTSLSEQANAQPIAVVQSLSVRGVEYTMMMLPLWLGAGALLWIALSVVNDETSFGLLALPAALLVVCMPLFAYFFIRLKRAELVNPALRFDPSKRKLTQFTQIVAFAACLFNVIGFVYSVMQKIGGTGSVSLGKSAINLLIVLIIAGGILAYYWIDEHKNFN